MLLDKTRDDYVVINTPPGAGKTSLFTHDMPAWLLCGGGAEDPAVGRALRLMLGHRAKAKAVEYVLRLRRFLTLKAPFSDNAQKREAELLPVAAFGRFKPDDRFGEEILWRRDEFVVAQIAGRELYQKEPSVQAASQESGFLGARVDFYSWDDLVTTDNSSKAETADAVARCSRTRPRAASSRAVSGSSSASAFPTSTSSATV
jgi:hypothetical protein